MLVPDFMHEFELGVWKATLTHLIRILHVFGEDAIQNLNQRYIDQFIVVSSLTFLDID